MKCACNHISPGLNCPCPFGAAKENAWERNKKIESLIKEKDAKGESYSSDDKNFISQYSGAGGQAKQGAKGVGVLYEFYTPDWLCKAMWQLAEKHGFKGGTVLEPSCATGNLIKDAPDKSKVYAFETNPITKRIAEILYPELKIYKGFFETAFLQPPRFTQKLKGQYSWLQGYPFDLVIANPPYGKYTNQYSSYFTKPQLPSMETFFMYYGLHLLKPGGLLVYLISSNFLRNGVTYEKAKTEIADVGQLVDAYRLPPVFEYSEVPVDVLVIKRIE